MQPEFHSGAVTRPLSAILQLAMMGCPALRARGELAAGACAPVLGWDRRGSSSAGARAWWCWPCRISGVEPTILAKVASMGLPSSDNLALKG